MTSPLSTSVLIAEATTGKRVAFTKSALSDNDQNYGVPRYVEQVSIIGAQLSTPPEWGYSRGFGAVQVSAVDSADITNLPSDLMEYVVPLADCTKLYVAASHKESAGTCDITPILFDAGRERFNSYAYELGEFIHVGVNQNAGIDIGQCYECTTAGTTAAADTFDWTTLSYGETHEDGTCVWTCRYSGRIFGQLEKKTATASTLRRGSSSGLYLSPLLSWDVCGAWFAGIHITALSTSNEVELLMWAI